MTFSCKTFKITSTAVTVTSSSCKSNHKTQFSVIQTLPMVFKNARKTTFLFRASFCQHLNPALLSVIKCHLSILLHEVGYKSAPPSGQCIWTKWTIQLTAVGITFTWQSSNDWHWKTDLSLTCSRPLLPARAVVPSQGMPRALGWGLTEHSVSTCFSFPASCGSRVLHKGSCSKCTNSTLSKASF